MSYLDDLFSSRRQGRGGDRCRRRPRRRHGQGLGRGRCAGRGPRSHREAAVAQADDDLWIGRGRRPGHRGRRHQRERSQIRTGSDRREMGAGRHPPQCTGDQLGDTGLRDHPRGVGQDPRRQPDELFPCQPDLRPKNGGAGRGRFHHQRFVGLFGTTAQQGLHLLHHQGRDQQHDSVPRPRVGAAQDPCQRRGAGFLPRRTEPQAAHRGTDGLDHGPHPHGPVRRSRRACRSGGVVGGRGRIEFRNRYADPGRWRFHRHDHLRA